MKLEQIIEYDKPIRLYSYGVQINEILKYLLENKLKKAKILNIGTGSQFLKGYFNNINKVCQDVSVDIVELDYDKELGPDIVADLRNGIPLDEKFDIIVCCQVLQYIDYGYFKKILEEFKRVCKNNGRVVLSMTDSGYYIFLELRMPTLFKKLFFNFNLFLPKVHSKSIATWGKDYWEINRKGYRIDKIKKEIEQNFIIRRSFRLEKHKYHHFFILEHK